jgi:hypothetical protein
MKSGYAYKLNGPVAGWRTAKDDDWEVEQVTRVRGASFVGFRTIDGARCTVWLITRKGVGACAYAQTAAHTPAPRGLR